MKKGSFLRCYYFNHVYLLIPIYSMIAIINGYISQRYYKKLMVAISCRHDLCFPHVYLSPLYIKTVIKFFWSTMLSILLYDSRFTILSVNIFFNLGRKIRNCVNCGTSLWCGHSGTKINVTICSKLLPKKKYMF